MKVKIRSYTGVHWRFNEGDFFGNGFKNHNENKVSARGLSNNATKQLHRTLNHPEYFLDQLIPHLAQNYNGTENSKTLFISSPMNTAKLFRRTGDYKNFKIFTTTDTQAFLREKLEEVNCTILVDMFGDILSTFEKEILLRSLGFYRTRPSNWSFNIQGHRWAEYGPKQLTHDRVIFDVFMGRNRRDTIKNTVSNPSSSMHSSRNIKLSFKKSNFIKELLFK